MRNDRDGIFTRSDRDGYWMHWKDVSGRRRFRKLGGARTLAEARRARSAEIVRVEQSRVLGFLPPGKESFEEVADRYLKYQKHRLTPASYKRAEGIVNDHLSSFFPVPIAGIRRGDVQRYVTERLGSGLSGDSVTKELNTLRHLLNLAVEWELIPLNPSIGVKRPRIAPGRVRNLQYAELENLLSFAPAWLRPIIAMAVATGMRRSELLGIRWVNVDLKAGRIILPITKNGELRIVYCNALSAFVLKGLAAASPLRLPTDQLFGEVTGEQVSVAFKRTCRKVKIEDFRFHDLRHTTASWLRMQGADIHTVAKLLGHKDLRMAMRYQHLSPEYLSEAMTSLDKVFPASCYQDVTETKLLEAQVEVSASESWRPRRDLNPCYRRERAVS